MTPHFEEISYDRTVGVIEAKMLLFAKEQQEINTVFFYEYQR
jgi:hypothetical protein